MHYIQMRASCMKPNAADCTVQQSVCVCVCVCVCYAKPVRNCVHVLVHWSCLHIAATPVYVSVHWLIPETGVCILE